MSPDHHSIQPLLKVAFEQNDDDADRSGAQVTTLQEQIAEQTRQGIAGVESTARLQDTVAALEGRIVEMEENTRQSLYNIEVLLRNAVFYRGQSQSRGHAYQTHADPRM